MKMQLKNKSVWRSFLSAAAMVLLFIIGTGTDYLGFGIPGLSDYEQVSTYEDGQYKRTSENSLAGDYNVWTGPKDVQGRWDGKTTIEEGSMGQGGDHRPYSVETVTYVNGLRNGKSLTTYPGGEKPDKEVCYSMGKVISCQKSAAAGPAEVPASQLFFEQYPWYVNALNVRGHSDAFIRAFVDTLETILFAIEPTGDWFINYYDRALDSIEGTSYDTIVYGNSSLSGFMGYDEMKNDEFRLAVVDHALEAGSRTFDIVRTKYPGYLDFIDSLEFSEPEFEVFCDELDSILSTFEPLERNDPFFADSMDSRLYRALMVFGNYEEDTAEVSDTLTFFKSNPVTRTRLSAGRILREVQQAFGPQDISPRSVEVASAVFLSFILHYYDGDKIGVVLEETYNRHHSIISVPTLTTEFTGSESPTGADLMGYIHDDGGGSITSSGIAWATHFNPTTGDQTASSGVTSGSYAVALEGLAVETTYFARAFATNSAGTGYGNCVEFVPQGTTGRESVVQDDGFRIYPNPASETAFFSFHAESGRQIELSLINLKGQIELRSELSNLTSGMHEVELDLSALGSGIYQCRLSERGRIRATQTLLIIHE